MHRTRTGTDGHPPEDTNLHLAADQTPCKGGLHHPPPLSLLPPAPAKQTRQRALLFRTPEGKRRRRKQPILPASHVTSRRRAVVLPSLVTKAKERGDRGTQGAACLGFVWGGI